jgi:trimeric autotransporter adhesin
MRIPRLAGATLLIAGLLTTTVTDRAAFAFSTIDVAGPVGSESFGGRFHVLPNGNFLVVDQHYDTVSKIDVGAIYLYNGTTHARISMVTGATAGDVIGGGGFTDVGDSNVVVQSDAWQSSPGVHAGAVTWINGTTGLDGVVGASNSLVGSSGGDANFRAVTALTNGNYVVVSVSWDSPTGNNAGAATWGNGNGPLTGAISDTNSIVGSHLNDSVGNIGVTVLENNSNYVVVGESWNGAGSDRGAVTWGSGLGGTHGIVSSSNSIVGGTDSDEVGTGGITALTNGNFVISSPAAVINAVVKAGASTWCAGSAVCHGVVSDSNSLVGDSTNDEVGLYGTTPLSDGNYVVDSPLWDSDTLANVGAVTWVNGTAGRTGAVTAAISLIGATANDQVGDLTPVRALFGGNYVVSSPTWTNGSATVAGAVTWRAGGGAHPDTVRTGNSLVGTQHNDFVGVGGVVVLTNGNYVVRSYHWNNGGTAEAGAATWGPANGGPAAIGTITGANSLIGNTAFNDVGTFVTPLANGNYVVGSQSWRNGVGDAVGADTWADGTTGSPGIVTAANSIVGSHAMDLVGGSDVKPLANGNYILTDRLWDNGSVANAGAVTWARGDGTTSGVVGPGISIVGSSLDDRVGETVELLNNGNYVIDSASWDGPAGPDLGAVTWGNGTGGTPGAVSAGNSLIGTIAGDAIGSDGINGLPNGAYLVRSQDYDNGPIVDAGAVTFGGLAGVRGTINASNSLIGTIAHDVNGFSTRLTSGGEFVVGRSIRNEVTLVKASVTAPVISGTPGPITVIAQPGATSAIVMYQTPTATDAVGTPTVTCVPPSGSPFPLGTTTVTCTATDSDGLTSMVSFTVTVVSDYIPLSPARLADTRTGGTTVDGAFAGTGQIAGGTILDLPVSSRGGVPGDAVAATLNVTVTEATAPGFLTVYPCDADRPTASNLNYTTGGTIPNAVISRIAGTGGSAGHVCLYASQPLQLVVDVNGAFPPSTSYHPINPARLLDTRASGATIDGQQHGGGAVAAASVTALQMTGRAGVPADASAVVLNVTVTEPGDAGYATVYPCGTEPPTASNLNYTPGLTIPNLVIAKVGTNGQVCIFSQAATQLIADVDGYFPVSTSYTALVPARLLDTRPGAPTTDGASAGAGAQPLGSVTVVQVAGRGGVPANAATAVLNVTVTDPTAAGYVTVYPCGIDPPLASNLNFVARQTIPNAVLTKIGTNGNVCIFNSQPTQLIADVTGYFPG